MELVTNRQINMEKAVFAAVEEDDTGTFINSLRYFTTPQEANAVAIDIEKNMTKSERALCEVYVIKIFAPEDANSFILAGRDEDAYSWLIRNCDMEYISI